jgi:UTP--glucose-1-phosphate uridylyltransferase
MAVTTAVIPAAGFGTRFLPATKAVPKELLPIVDTPVIQLVIEEAVRAGIRDIVIVTGRVKTAIEDHFARGAELEAFLERKGKLAELDRVRAPGSPASVRFVVQDEPLGLGHAVSVVEHEVGGEPFAVLLPDDLMHPGVPLLAEMLDANARTGRSIVTALQVSATEISAYGCIEPGRVEGSLVRVLSVVEKPAPEDAPSLLAVIGRYVLTPDIFDALRRTEPGVGGEIQLTDAINLLANEQEVFAYRFDRGRFDTGTPLEYLKAIVELASEHDDVGPSFREWLADFVARESGQGRVQGHE